ncbi:MAG: phytanoyl-CoA dioxygenase [Alphaproteobacteria bacterium]|nr:MAG: phytanoyl-CoA dioxygenase [Alphaproteobacteria bacterium]
MVAAPLDHVALATSGFVHVQGAIPSDRIGALASLSPTAGAGTRLPLGAPLVTAALRFLAPIAADWRHDARAVRCVLFDKSAANNWLVPWHQDRTIAVAKRVPVAGFGPWSIKHGVDHVEPPFALLADMITMRLHIDDCRADNAPLRVVAGTHRQRYRAADVAAIAQAGTIATCIAAAGDVWVYSTPIVHASHSAVNPSRRRVLQIDFCASQLPVGLDWAA